MYRLLFLAAVLPAIFLIRKVYKMDTVEKEPAGCWSASCFSRSAPS